MDMDAYHQALPHVCEVVAQCQIECRFGTLMPGYVMDTGEWIIIQMYRDQRQLRLAHKFDHGTEGLGWLEWNRVPDWFKRAPKDIKDDHGPRVFVPFLQKEIRVIEAIPRGSLFENAPVNIEECMEFGLNSEEEEIHYEELETKVTRILEEQHHPGISCILGLSGVRHVGGNPVNQVCLRVMVNYKGVLLNGDDPLPSEIEGLPIDVVEGRFVYC